MTLSKEDLKKSIESLGFCVFLTDLRLFLSERDETGSRDIKQSINVINSRYS